MRQFFLQIFATLLFGSSIFANPVADTSGIVHNPDGLANEWPPHKFSADKENGVETAVVNDNENLHIIICIKQKAIQTKMLQNGMCMFIDMKGKHKKNHGVEFPLHQAGSVRQNPNADPGALAIITALDPAIKVFGFTESEPVLQRPDIESGIQLGFAQDSTGAMNIEYLIPLEILEKETAQLNQRGITIGWLINGLDDMPQRFQGNSNTLGGLRNNGITKPSGNPGPEIPVYNPEMEKILKEQEFWVHHTIVF